MVADKIVEAGGDRYAALFIAKKLHEREVADASKKGNEE